MVEPKCCLCGKKDGDFITTPDLYYCKQCYDWHFTQLPLDSTQEQIIIELNIIKKSIETLKFPKLDNNAL